LVLRSLRSAGWVEGRRFDSSAWVEWLEGAGYEPSPLALQIWSALGGLTIASAESRVPASSLWVEPMDACIDSFEEAAKLERRFGEVYSPLGMWSVQYRSYVSVSGRVVAVGPLVVWDLGSSFAEALAYIVKGDAGGSRAQQADWLARDEE
jgi:hypothetical protein